MIHPAEDRSCVLRGSFWKRAGSHVPFETLLPFKSGRFPSTCPASVLQDHIRVLSEPQGLAILKTQEREDNQQAAESEDEISENLYSCTQMCPSRQAFPP